MIPKPQDQESQAIVDLMAALEATGASRWSAFGMVATSMTGVGRLARREWVDYLTRCPRGAEPLLALLDLGAGDPTLANRLLALWLRDRHVDSDLDLSGVTWVESLPEGLVVEGNLFLVDCPFLAHLPKGLRVGGHLVLGRCPALRSLPANMDVGVDLILKSCHSLRRAGPGSFVYRYVDLFDCPIKPAVLRKNLDIGGRLLCKDP